MAEFLDQSPEDFLAYSPEDFLKGEQTAIEDTKEQSHKVRNELALGVALGVAFLVWRQIMKRKLLENPPESIDHAYSLANKVWKQVAPGWMRMTTPAIIAAYQIASEAIPLSDEQLEWVAAEYSASLGEYLATTSSQALLEGYTAQVTKNVTPRLAWERVTQAYGLDSNQMQSTVKRVLTADIDYPSKLMPDNVMTSISQMLNARAERVGRQEAYASMQMGKSIVWMYKQKLGEIPDDALKEWLTAEDERVCPECGPLDHVTAQIPDKFTSVNGAKYWAPSIHINCFPAGTLVRGPKITGSFSRWYKGKMLDIRTESGQILSVTPNHPILTDQGWIAAGNLNVGSQIVTERRSERPPGSDPHHNDHLAIEQVGEFLSGTNQVLTTRVPMTTKDFHGDGTVTEVDVVRTDSLLSDDWKADHVRDLILQGRSEELDAFTGFGELVSMLRGMALAFDCGVSSFRVPDVLFSSASRHHQPISVGIASDLNTFVNDDSSDDWSGDTKIVSESLQRFTGEISLDQIVSIGQYNFSGHVYNLQTDGGWYIANGVIVHNCRCSIRLADSEVSKAMGKDPYDRNRSGQFAAREMRQPAPELAPAPEITQVDEKAEPEEEQLFKPKKHFAFKSNDKLFKEKQPEAAQPEAAVQAETAALFAESQVVFRQRLFQEAEKPLFVRTEKPSTSTNSTTFARELVQLRAIKAEAVIAREEARAAREPMQEAKAAEIPKLVSVKDKPMTRLIAREKVVVGTDVFAKQKGTGFASYDVVKDMFADKATDKIPNKLIPPVDNNGKMDLDDLTILSGNPEAPVSISGVHVTSLPINIDELTKSNFADGIPSEMVDAMARSIEAKRQPLEATRRNIAETYVDMDLIAEDRLSTDSEVFRGPRERGREYISPEIQEALKKRNALKNMYGDPIVDWTPSIVAFDDFYGKPAEDGSYNVAGKYTTAMADTSFDVEDSDSDPSRTSAILADTQKRNFYQGLVSRPGWESANRIVWDDRTGKPDIVHTPPSVVMDFPELFLENNWSKYGHIAVVIAYPANGPVQMEEEKPGGNL